MRVAFFGTPATTRPLLRALAAHAAPVGVWTRPDAPAGRGRQLRPAAVFEEARALGLAPIRTPRRLDKDEAAALRALDCDLAVVFAYGLKFPAALLSVPKWGAINLHPSLLPRWRGASPVAATLLAGDSVAGWSWIQMTETVDAGPILAQESVPLRGDETAGELEAHLVKRAAAFLPSLLEAIRNGNARPTPQDETKATHAPRLAKGAGQLDWRRPAAELERRVRGLSPRPGAWAALAHEAQSGRGRLKILRAEVARGATGDEASLPPGTRRDDKGALTVACGRGALTLVEVQAGGGRPCSGAAFLRGHRVPMRLPLPAR